MIVSSTTILLIIGMGLVTYATRVGGYLLLRNYSLNKKQAQMMQIAPGCVFISIIVPEFLTGTTGDILALCVTIIAALKLGMLGTIIIAMCSAFTFNWLLLNLF